MLVNELKAKLAHLGVPDDVFGRYNELHRYYHTLTHIEDIYRQLTERQQADNQALLLATIYHDVIYDPQSATNG